jgi:hypothetical protein
LKNLKFTVEGEKNNQVDFLDVTVSESDNKVNLGIDTKPTGALKYLFHLILQLDPTSRSTRVLLATGFCS